MLRGRLRVWLAWAGAAAMLLAPAPFAVAQNTPPPAQPQPARPTTVPVTRPAFDASTPKGALRSLNVAMRDGNRQQIRSLMYTRDPLESQMVDSMAAMAEALAMLHRAAVAQFGPESAKGVTGDNDARWAEGLARIESAEVKVNGDAATVLYRSAPPQTQKTAANTSDRPAAPTPASEKAAPVTLRRERNGWKLPVSQLATGAAPGALEQRLAELAVQTRLVREIADEIADGKFDTADQAADAWTSRFMQSLGPKPATRPAVKGEKVTR